MLASKWVIIEHLVFVLTVIIFFRPKSEYTELDEDTRK